MLFLGGFYDREGPGYIPKKRQLNFNGLQAVIRAAVEQSEERLPTG
jgi:hypothetical protein